MWNGEGGQVSSSSDYSNVAEDSIFSSILLPDDCGIRWETQLQMRMKFKTANRNLTVCKNRLKRLYNGRDELKDKLTLIQLQINRAEAAQRKAEGSFKTCHYPILPDFTNKDIECVLKMGGHALQEAALSMVRITDPDSPLFDDLTKFTPYFNDPVDYFTTPAGPSTSSARLVSSTAGPVVRAVRPGRPVVRAVPTLLPLRHASLTSAFDAGFRSVEFTTGPNNNNDNNKPVETIKSLKVKRLLIKPILPVCRKPSRKEFWQLQSQVIKNASGEEDYIDLLASSD